jgi:hypothetical protein
MLAVCSEHYAGNPTSIGRKRSIRLGLSMIDDPLVDAATQAILIAAFAAVALLLSGLSLGECPTATAGSSLMDARAQAAPPKASIYDPPPQRENPAMTTDERLKMQKELNTARDRQGAASKAKAHPAPAQPAKP